MKHIAFEKTPTWIQLYGYFSTDELDEFKTVETLLRIAIK
jgi:hypothetical protein